MKLTVTTSQRMGLELVLMPYRLGEEGVNYYTHMYECVQRVKTLKKSLCSSICKS